MKEENSFQKKSFQKVSKKKKKYQKNIRLNSEGIQTNNSQINFPSALFVLSLKKNLKDELIFHVSQSHFPFFTKTK